MTPAILSRHYTKLIICLAAFTAAAVAQQRDENWQTPYELSGCVATPTFDSTMIYIQRLSKASPLVRIASIGSTLQGRNIPLVVVSSDSIANLDVLRKGSKPVVLIQAGIHSGEIDGKDAGLMLLRDIAITGTYKHFLDSVVVLFVPIFNIDGHERRSPYNRINQDGPVETGWRVTASNLNLNRDFMKADAPEMRAWLRMFAGWQPDMVIDIHVTDGIDFQYNLTYSMEMFSNAPAGIVAWHKDLEKALIAGMKAKGDPIIPYVFPREDRDLSKGILTYAAPPRFSTGYAAIRNRAAMLVETHMLKPYKARVNSTYRLLVEILSYIHANPGSLRNAVRNADQETSTMFTTPPAAPFPLRYQNVFEHPDTMEFLGYAMTEEQSGISGGTYPVWHHERPVTVRVPYFSDVRASRTVVPPVAYIVPNEWNEVLTVLNLHGVTFERLTAKVRVPVETYTLTNPEWQAHPYEGRHPLRFKTEVHIDTIEYPRGTIVVRLNQPAAKAAIHLLEPDAPDALAGWGFFDTIFEQKEYFEDYVMEGVGRDMLNKQPALRAEFESKVKSDTAFARSPRARLKFLYERSPWWDKHINVYPVARYMKADGLPSVNEKEFRKLNAPRKKAAGEK
jgi:hypothetical protein